jgi:hypothetical protein
MRETDEVDRRHHMILEEIRKGDAEFGERVLLRLRDVAASWGG